MFMSVRALLATVMAAAALCLTASPALAAAAQPAAAQPAAAPDPNGADQPYILGPEDIIDVQVLGRTDFNARPKIAQDGTILLPFIGSTPAANRTTKQLGEEISKLLSEKGYFTNPIVSVEVSGYASRYVTVLGDVIKPGLVPVDRPMHLSELLARVGGVRDTASEFLTVRTARNEERRWSVIELAKGDPANDPWVSPGDKIFAPKAETFYISGEVRAPSAYPLETGMTLRTAIARAGGLTPLGSGGGAKVTHKGGAKGKLKPEDMIAAGDVIVIGEKLF
jgi:polysaccharide export outer membrane protein